MKRSKDDVDVNSPLKPVDHPDLEDDRGLMRDDKEQRRRNEEEKDQIAEDPAAEPLHDADENFGTSPVSPASEGMYIYGEGLDFLHNIKENLCNPENFQDLLKYLHIYGRNIITREELQLLVGHLLGESVDLMKGFNDFLSLCENHQKWLEESCESHQIFVE